MDFLGCNALSRRRWWTVERGMKEDKDVVILSFLRRDTVLSKDKELLAEK